MPSSDKLPCQLTLDSAESWRLQQNQFMRGLSKSKVKWMEKLEARKCKGEIYYYIQRALFNSNSAYEEEVKSECLAEANALGCLYNRLFNPTCKGVSIS